MRIMIVGDSMTVGSRGDYTWRYRLWRHLRGSGADVAFVGPYTRLYDRTTGTATAVGYRDPEFETAHHAVWGRPMSRLTARIAADITAYRPDLLLVMMGLIDLGFYTLAERTEANLRAFIDRARAAAPAIGMVVAAVPENDRAHTDTLFAAQRADFNRRQARALGELSTPRSPLVRAAPPADWDLLADTYDGTHLSPRGEHRIAAMFAGALHARFELGTAYGTIPASHPGLPAPSPPTVRGRATGALLSWDPVAGADGYHVLVRDVTADLPWSRLPWPVAGLSCPFDDLLPGHGYAFAVRALRGNDESASSPTVRLGERAPAYG